VVHAVKPVDVEKVPAAQLAQLEEPVELWKVPAAQLEHEVAPDAPYLPIAQLEHTLAAVVVE